MTAAATNIELAISVVRRSLFDPEFFVKNVLKSDYDDWQIELLEAVADIDRLRFGIPTKYNHTGLTRFSIRSCHGTGKTTGMAMLMHYYQFTHRARIPCTAPKEGTIKTRLFPAFRGLMSRSDAGYRKLVRPGYEKIEWGAKGMNWEAIAEAAAAPENLAGYHPTIDSPCIMFLVEEASGVNDLLFPVVEGALSTEGAILVMISNPTKNTGEFWRSHNKKGTKELYYKMHVPPEKSKYVDPQWVEQMERKYGKESPIVKIRCRGEFADADPSQLIDFSWVEDSYVEEHPPEDGSLYTWRITVDVADGGVDKTVLTACKRYETFDLVVKQKAYSFPKSKGSVMSAEAAEKMFESLGCDKSRDDLVVDALGVGAGTTGILVKKGYNVVSYKGGSASDDPKKWGNRRTQSYMCLRDDFRDGTMLIMESAFGDELEREEMEGHIMSIRTKDNSDKIEELVTKKAMKDKGIESPDRADGIAMIKATQEPMLSTPDDWEQEFEAAMMGIVGGEAVI